MRIETFMRPFHVLSVSVILSSCSVIPDIPDDYSLPVAQIMQHAACELRDAFIELNKKEYASFDAQNWQIAVTLTPKADREFTAGGGLTGKTTSNTKILYFTNWAVSGPGLQYDAKGTRNATAVYSFTSKELLDFVHHPLSCEYTSPTYNELTRNLGIKQWLIRSVNAKKNSLGGLGTLDKPTYSSEILIKYSGNGVFTYNFPFGTDFGSLSASYDTDETLSMALTKTAKKSVIVVQTLPTGGQFGDGPPATIVIPSRVETPSRLDALESEQNIINAINGLQRSLQ
jgi:hypothetical protein